MTKIKFGVTSVDYSASIENTPTLKLGLMIRGSRRLDASSVIKKLIKDISELEYELEE
ncbi:hypothetical protein Javan318_0036 [Streptococcus phage Javan318]|nr:hypothetical protein Javan318_0036 [Streptococcus phage Javan318]